MTAISAVEPPVDVVFLAGLGSEFPVAVKQAKSADFGIRATFLGGDGWDRPDLVEIGGMAVEGSFFVNHFSSGGDPERLSEDGRKFVAAYTEMFGVAPDGLRRLDTIPPRLLSKRCGEQPTQRPHQFAMNLRRHRITAAQ